MKRIVLEDKAGMRHIIGATEEQPPDMLDLEGALFGLVSLKRRRYYLYRPVLSPSESMQLFHGSQR